MSDDTWTLGILGGSGLYDIEGLKNAEWIEIDTPWGKPSDAILFAELDGIKLRFLPRHGRGHKQSPSSVNYRANIDALKRAGCTDLLSLSAVGSLQEQYVPGDFVLVDQFIDRTFAREAEMPYATVAMITDFDCWHPDHGNVDVAAVIATLMKNADAAKGTVREIIKLMAETPRTLSPQGIETNLDVALITSPEARDPKTLAKLDAILGRVLGA